MFNNILLNKMYDITDNFRNYKSNYSFRNKAYLIITFN